MGSLADKLKDLVKPHITPRTIIDIGSYNGDWSTEAKICWPDVETIKIEPQPNMGQDIEALLYHESGHTIPFYCRDGAATGASLYREDSEFFNDENVSVVMAETKTLDDVMRGQRFRLPMLVKIDTQGSEYLVILGGECTLGLAKALIIEMAVSNYNKGAIRKEMVDKRLRDIGFKPLVKLADIEHPWNPGTVIQEDWLYMR